MDDDEKPSEKTAFLEGPQSSNTDNKGGRTDVYGEIGHKLTNGIFIRVSQSIYFHACSQVHVEWIIAAKSQFVRTQGST